MPALQRSALHIAMGIPAPVVELNEADAALAEAPRQETIIGKTVLARLDAIRFMSLRWFAGNIRRFGNAHLHAERQLILTDARERFRVAEFFRRFHIDFVDG